MTKNKLEKRIAKLEAKLEELLDYLKLESFAEEKDCDFSPRGHYFDVLITKKRKNDW